VKLFAEATTEVVALSKSETIFHYLKETPEALLLLSPIIIAVYLIHIKIKNDRTNKLDSTLYPTTDN
jgi:hypothetical protein